MWILLSWIVFLAIRVPAASRIKHVVVLFEENRSFDHFFGWSRKKLGVDGLWGNETNPVNVSDPSQGVVAVEPTAPYIAQFDPNHGFPAYIDKLFGNSTASRTTSRNDGFYAFESKHHGRENGTFVMKGFLPEKIPISATLAEEFAVFDKWYSAHPGPSWPNHMFSFSGTSMGCTETGAGYKCIKHNQFPQKTIFDSLIEAGLTYKRIYNDSSGEMYMKSFHTAEAKNNTHNMDEFFYDAAHGTLPTLTWIQPREGVNKSMGKLGGPNSDHPACCDIALGERLRKDIYEALRAGPGWNETAFIFTWDDAGGFYDHVPTPMYAPAPDDEISCPDKNFKFDRLGNRLPVVLISPWVKKGTVIGEAKGPLPSSRYDSTSIISTIAKIFNLPFLTKRDAWSGTFEDVFLELESPRDDCPLHLPHAPPPGANINRTFPWGTDCDEPTRRMRRSIKLFEHINNVTAPPRLHSCAHNEPYWLNKCESGTMLEASEWLSEQMIIWKQSTSVLEN